MCVTVRCVVVVVVVVDGGGGGGGDGGGGANSLFAFFLFRCRQFKRDKITRQTTGVHSAKLWSSAKLYQAYHFIRQLVNENFPIYR